MVGLKEGRQNGQNIMANLVDRGGKGRMPRLLAWAHGQVVVSFTSRAT